MAIAEIIAKYLVLIFFCIAVSEWIMTPLIRNCETITSKTRKAFAVFAAYYFYMQIIYYFWSVVLDLIDLDTWNVNTTCFILSATKAWQSVASLEKEPDEPGAEGAEGEIGK